MTTIRVDPHRPGVPTAAVRCPGCRRTLSQIIWGGESLPPWHYRGPPHVGHLVRWDNKGGWGGRPQPSPLCTYNGDDLSRLVFLAQLAAEAVT